MKPGLTWWGSTDSRQPEGNTPGGGELEPIRIPAPNYDDSPGGSAWKDTTMPAPDAILDATFLKKLERLTLATRRPFSGQMKGEKRSLKRGSSIEFADYREYSLGDDLR